MKNILEYVTGNVKVVERSYGSFGVTRLDGTVIVPFGKYDWIEEYDKSTGLARVKIGKVASMMKNNGNKWGLIDMEGNEVLPVEYDVVRKFLNRNYVDVIIEKNGKESKFNLCSWRNTAATYDSDIENYYDDDYESGGSYTKYKGYNGYDDNTIDDAFDGDPDATWNID